MDERNLGTIIAQSGADFERNSRAQPLFRLRGNGLGVRVDFSIEEVEHRKSLTFALHLKKEPRLRPSQQGGL